MLNSSTMHLSYALKRAHALKQWLQLDIPVRFVTLHLLRSSLGMRTRGASI